MSDRNDIAVYVVWSSQLGAEERHVAGGMRMIPDRRARHYWDGNRVVGTTYQRLLGLSAAAWDVWMLFDRGAVWTDDGPPRPAWWEHQLQEASRELFLDPNPERFAARGNQLLQASEP